MTKYEKAPSAGVLVTLPSPANRNTLTLRELIDAFMSSYAGRDNAIGRRLAWWLDRLGDRQAFAITDADVDDLVGELAMSQGRTWKGRDADGNHTFKPRGPLSGTTCNRYLTTLGSLYKWAKRRRITPRGFISPTRGIERFPEPPHRVRYLSDEERERLFAVANVSSWPKLYALILMALTTGARKGELLSLRWRDVDIDKGVASVTTSKNGEPRVLPLTQTLVRELLRFRRQPDRLVFESPRIPGKPMSVEMPWRKALIDAKIENFRFHDLRHSCASYLAQSGASLLEIADVLGHRQVSVVRRYAHLSVDSKAALVRRVLGGIR